MEVLGLAPLFPQRHVAASTFNPPAAARDLEAAGAERRRAEAHTTTTTTDGCDMTPAPCC